MFEVVESGLAVVVSGPSGSGKTTLVKRLMMRYAGSHFSISSTTRALRGEELDGIDYRFVSRDDFLELRGRDGFLEWAEVHGEFYGTPRDEVVSYLQDGRHVFLDIDIQGGLSVRESLGDRALLLYVLPPDRETLETRLRKRGTETEPSIALRLENAIDELKVLPSYDAVVVNDDLDEAVDTADEILDARRKNCAEWLSGEGRGFMKDRFGLDL